LKRVGRRDDFFELGGHSFLAVRLFSVIERKLGVKLELRILFQGATVAELAAAVDRAREEKGSWSSLVPLKAGGTKPPLFLTPGLVNAELLKYRELVPLLDPDQPVYGLQAFGLDEGSQPIARVEEMAASYVEEIRSFQPHGPYHLAGLCFGGLVAYEMARRLTDLGEEVALLALIDSSPMVHRRLRGSKSRREIERIKWAAFLRSDLRGKANWLARRAWGVKEKVALISGQVVYKFQTKRGGRLPRRPWNMVYIANVLAMQRYAISPSASRITLFWVSSGPGDRRPTRWEQFAGGGVDLRVIEAEGINHSNMMRAPYVELVAAELTKVLDAVHAGEYHPQS
jgi:thioesterase domain-containing protein